MIDWNRVSDLREEVGEDDFDEVAQMFLDEVEQELADLVEHPDPGCLEGRLHFLKGSALNLGFVDFAALCQDGEAAAGKGLATTVDVTAIIHCYAASRQAFDIMLRKLAA